MEILTLKNLSFTYPDVGASKYVLSDGDTVEWVYTCDAEGGK